MIMNNEAIFSRIISQGYWLNHVCGTGSTMLNTTNIREQLPQVLKELQCNSLLDAPCGDHSWMSTIEWPQGFVYIGADVVSDMIVTCQQRWPDKDFRHLDIINDPLPQADVMLCRDCFIHFPWRDIRRALENIVASDIKYLATTCYISGEQQDIEMGQCHHINLKDQPSCFPEPQYAILDQGHQTLEHYIMFWDQQQLKTVLENWK